MVSLALEWFHRETLLFVLTYLRRFFVRSPIGGYGEPSVILSCNDINKHEQVYEQVYVTKCVCAFMGVYEGNISLKIKNLKNKVMYKGLRLTTQREAQGFLKRFLKRDGNYTYMEAQKGFKV